MGDWLNELNQLNRLNRLNRLNEWGSVAVLI
jgi:hypothetical protein